MPKKKYTEEAVRQRALEDGAEVLGELSEVTREKSVEFRCKCGEVGRKTVYRFISHAGGLCRKCMLKKRGDRQRELAEEKRPAEEKERLKKIEEDNKRMEAERDVIVSKIDKSILKEDQWFEHSVYNGCFGNILGQVKRKNHIYDCHKKQSGYVKCNIELEPGKRVGFAVHRFIMECIYGNTLPKYLHVDHIDRNRSNNNASNLQILTVREHVIKTHKDNPATATKSKYRTHNVKVRQYKIDNDNRLIDENIYESINTAAENTGISKFKICKAISNKEKIDGYYWERVENEYEIIDGEEWKTLDYISHVNISNMGRVRYKSINNTLCVHYGYLTDSGYYRIIFKGKSYLIHRLVCEAFYGPAPEGKSTVDHIDRNPQNNRADNLRWSSMQEQAINKTTVRPVESYDMKTLKAIKQFKSCTECAEYYSKTVSDICSTLALKKKDGFLSLCVGGFNSGISVRHSNISIEEKKQRERNILEHYTKMISTSRCNRERELPMNICCSESGRYTCKISFRGQKYVYSDRDLQKVIEVKEEWFNEQIQNRVKEIEEAVI